MATNETHLINITALENRLGELDLKNWWVAEQLGVDRKTVARWLSGKVRTIKDENLQALARCLECQPQDLILRDETAVVASKEEQTLAARLIVQDDLLATLTPLGQWPLLESIVKTAMQPDLPLPILGKLYNLLSVCSWRRSRMDKAVAYADKALELGQKIGHRGVSAQARNNLAVVASYQGRLSQSIALYESVISERNFLEDDRAVAAALSNLAQDYQSYGDFEKSRRTQKDAIALYTRLGLPLNLSIACCALGLLETEAGNYDEAETVLRTSLQLAVSANYVRGQSAHRIYLADCLALKGDFAQAETLLEEGFAGFAELKLKEALNFEIRGRFFRLQGRCAEAEAALREGLACVGGFPLEVASLKIEMSRLYLACGRPEESGLLEREAQEVYRKSGALLRSEK